MAEGIPKTKIEHDRSEAPGRKTARPVVPIPSGYVLVPAKTLEDLYDLAAIRKGRREKTMSLEAVERQLRVNGRL